MSNARVCFIGSGSTTFIERDWKILESLGYGIDQHSFKGNLLTYLFLYRREIKKTIQKSDIVFGWFASWETMAGVYYAKRYRKKSIVIVGGYDLEYMPEINYGAFTNIKEKIPARYVIDNATLLMPFSEYAANRLKELKAKANFITIDLGCDIDKFFPKGKKEDIILTVGGVKQNNLKRKGLENFVKTAKYLPEKKFILAGKFIDNTVNYLKSIATSNVEFTGFLPEKELIELYQKAKVYCQLSYQEGEGAGGAVGEAMACGCIPVVSDKAVALQDTVGETGFYVPHGNPKETAKIIQQALDAQESLGEKARKKIVNNFSIEQRKERLNEIIINTISNNKPYYSVF